MRIIKRYRSQVNQLEDDRLYSSSGIAQQIGNASDERQLMRRVLERLIRLNQFPADGDGSILVHGMIPIPAWFGRRWKQAVNNLE